MDGTENLRFKILLKPILFSLLLLLARITICEHLKTQFFACLLALLAGQPRFRLLIGLISLTVGLLIGKAEFIGEKVSIGFSGCLW